MRHRERVRDIGRGISRLPTEPNTRLDPRTLGSQPEPKAEAQPLGHPGAPTVFYDSYEVQGHFFLRFYLFIHERHRKRGRDIGRGRSRVLTGSLMWDSIPRPCNHALSWRQTLNCWATQVSSWPGNLEHILAWLKSPNNELYKPWVTPCCSAKAGKLIPSPI